MAGRPCHASAQAPGACAAAGKAVTAGKEDVTFMLEYSLSPAQPSSVMQRSHAPSPLVLRLGMLALAASVASCGGDRKSTRLNSSHLVISYAVFCLKKKKLP